MIILILFFFIVKKSKEIVQTAIYHESNQNGVKLFTFIQ